MKKSDRIARELEQSVTASVDNARDWAAPRVEAAVNWAVPRIQHGIDTASPRIQEGLKSAAHNLADGVAVVTPRIQDGLAHLAPKIHDVVEDATPRIQETLNKATPALGLARDKVVVEYLPKLSEQLGQASVAVHHVLENAPAQVDAVAQRLVDSGVVHSVQEQAQATGKQIKVVTDQASKAVSAALVKEQPKPKKRGWLIVTVIAAAAAAGVAAWKASKPVEDPWKTPSPVTPTPAPVPSTTTTPAPADASVSATAAAVAEPTASDLTPEEAAAEAEQATKDAFKNVEGSTENVATDAKTAVKNIAASLHKDSESKNTEGNDFDAKGTQS
ncbi:hypothetical protein ACLRGI_09785 [Paenarthrobacter nitroguajacolicus]|uniref:hypothetical protein n=1 Tax=Paenarthrobacter nitroguajacolicus TaxID=211146 RepID=UPI003ADA26E6